MCQIFAFLHPIIGFIPWVQQFQVVFSEQIGTRDTNHICRMLTVLCSFSKHNGCTLIIPSATWNEFVKGKTRVLNKLYWMQKMDIARADFHVFAWCETGWVFAKCSFWMGLDDYFFIFPIFWWFVVQMFGPGQLFAWTQWVWNSNVAGNWEPVRWQLRCFGWNENWLCLDVSTMLSIVYATSRTMMNSRSTRQSQLGSAASGNGWKISTIQLVFWLPKRQGASTRFPDVETTPSSGFIPQWCRLPP